MSRLVFLVLSVFACQQAIASIPLEASLSDLACGADHVLVGRVVEVDMVNAKGRLVRDKRARTGPGLKNTIRLHVEVIEVIDSPSSPHPNLVKVSLDPFMHYSLGQIQAAHTAPSEPMLVFLRGKEFSPVVAGRFFWSLDAREEALSIRTACRP